MRKFFSARLHTFRARYPLLSIGKLEVEGFHWASVRTSFDYGKWYVMIPLTKWFDLTIRIKE